MFKCDIQCLIHSETEQYVSFYLYYYPFPYPLPPSFFLDVREKKGTDRNVDKINNT